uniref:Erythronate-4-phosphate dehydrogenase family protein n=1 Tax=Kalanchoe fedtschenkoi TaxID=63787 RepID=A0A7N0TXS0_KALFE
MDCSFETRNKVESFGDGHRIIRHLSYQPCNKRTSAWFDLKVFYVRVSNLMVDDSTPEFLSITHVPLSPDTLLEVNGLRCGLSSDGVSTVLRRDRMDKKCEEATFVGTDSIRITGSVKFEVFDKDRLILSGVLEMSSAEGFAGDAKSCYKRWSMNCETQMIAGTGFLKGRHCADHELVSPTIEVYVAGCFSGTPIVLTKALQLSHRKKPDRQGMLEAIPENETTEEQKYAASRSDYQESEFKKYLLETRRDHNYDYKYNDQYWRRTELLEGEDGELSWFNAGVRVGVGIGMGVCLGLGIGVGLLVRTYQGTRNMKRRLL